ncbi:MAG: hypothetical protein JJE51_05915 [Thermoanaerobaculia bacterium]|nr:hypothetical protein [Thermoanaerobaculia bacterium]
MRAKCLVAWRPEGLNVEACNRNWRGKSLDPASTRCWLNGWPRIRLQDGQFLVTWFTVTEERKLSLQARLVTAVGSVSQVPEEWLQNLNDAWTLDFASMPGQIAIAYTVPVAASPYGNADRAFLRLLPPDPRPSRRRATR